MTEKRDRAIERRQTHSHRCPSPSCERRKVRCARSICGLRFWVLCGNCKRAIESVLRVTA